MKIIKYIRRINKGNASFKKIWLYKKESGNWQGKVHEEYIGRVVADIFCGGDRKLWIGQVYHVATD